MNTHCDIHGYTRAICAVCAKNDLDTAGEEIERLTSLIDEMTRAWREYCTTPTTEAWEYVNKLLTELE